MTANPKVTRSGCIYALARLCGVTHKLRELSVLSAATQLLSTGELGDRAPAAGILLALVERNQWDGETSKQENDKQETQRESQESDDGEA